MRTVHFILVAVLGFAALCGCGESKPGEEGAPAPHAEAPADDPLEAVRPILERKGKIQAIKAYRELTGVGLREAKDAVDSLKD